MVWDSEWQDASKKTSTLNAQAGNLDWDSNMLLGEGPYKGQTDLAGYVRLCTDIGQTPWDKE